MALIAWPAWVLTASRPETVAASSLRVCEDCSTIDFKGVLPSLKRTPRSCRTQCGFRRSYSSAAAFPHQGACTVDCPVAFRVSALEWRDLLHLTYLMPQQKFQCHRSDPMIPVGSVTISATAMMPSPLPVPIWRHPPPCKH